MFAQKFKSELSNISMLKHPFYRAWSEGYVELSALSDYVYQYEPFVADFPRFVSAIHSHCPHEKDRSLLLQNLLEEEGFPAGKSHPVLWQQFKEYIKKLGYCELDSAPRKEAALKLVDVFWEACRAGYAEGLGALYAYEHQIPGVAKAKIDGLETYFSSTHSLSSNLRLDPGLEFFAVHEQADVYHSEACEQLLESLSLEERERALESGKKAAQALWNFLDLFVTPEMSRQMNCGANQHELQHEMQHDLKRDLQ